MTTWRDDGPARLVMRRTEGSAWTPTAAGVFSPCVAVAWFVALACARPASPLNTAASESPPRSGDVNVLFDRASRFGRVLVLDEGPRRVMRFGSQNGSTQSAIVRGQPEAMPVEYVRYALLGLAHHGHPTRLLMVGLGGGTFTTLVHRALPELTIDVVEIDPLVHEAARRYFGLREDARYRVHVADAAGWMSRDHDQGRYDYILLDAYAGEEIPAVLMTQTFFRDVERHLAPGGVVAINIAEPETQGSEVMRAFRAVLTPFDCYRTPLEGSVMIFAARRDRTADRNAFLRWLENWDAREWTNFSARAMANPTESSNCDRVLGGTP